MTRGEIEELKGLAASMGLYDDKNPCKRAVILGKAIKALEQEPTTKNDLGVDCISRAYLLDDSKYHTVFNDDTGNFEDVVYREDIEKAPSVTPHEPRKGKWYRQTNDYVDYYECSECGMAMGLYDVKNYCPNCGSRNEVEK